MISSIREQPFQPYLLASTAHQQLTELSLVALLNQVTQHKIVLLRGFDSISRDELLHYCQSQAQLLAWHFGPVMEMKVDATPKNYLFTEGDVPLHWDGAFHQEPRFLLFHCIQAPLAKNGGETLFVNTEKVWQAASKSQQREWQGYSLSYRTEKLAHYGGSFTRPLVNTHPDTLATLLRFAEPVGEDYLNPVQVQVEDKSPATSRAILSNLSQAMRSPTALYAHQWQTGDFLVADNFSLLHGRNAFSQHSPRHLRRIQIL